MKKNIIYICLIICLLLSGCGGYKGELYKDNNNNYKSSDVDDDGEIINKGNKEDISTNLEINQLEETNSYEEPFELKAYFIDVGNADCTLFLLPEGQTMLIDAGNNADGEDICTYLNKLGITKIDYLIGTHPHEDHIGGMDDIINSLEINGIYLPKIPDDKIPSTKTYEEVLTSVDNKNIFIINPFYKQLIYDMNDITIEFLSDTNEINSDNMNDYSLVVKVKYKDISFILQGDAEENIEEMLLSNNEADLINCTVLKIGHHGSSTSSSEKWLKTLSPQYAYIPCGKSNQYGHPHNEILKRLEKLNITYFRSDIDGTVVMSTNGKTINIDKNMTGNMPLGTPEWSETMIK